MSEQEDQFWADELDAVRRTKAKTSRQPTLEQWSQTKWTYQWLPRSIYDQLSGIGPSDALEALQDKHQRYDALIGLKVGDVACRALKNEAAEMNGLPAPFTLSHKDKQMLRLLRDLFRAAVGGDEAARA